MMTKDGHDEKLVNKFMRATDRLQTVLGEADHGDMDSPVVHRHDELEDESDEVLASLEERTDSDGHRYSVRKADEHGE